MKFLIEPTSYPANILCDWEDNAPATTTVVELGDQFDVLSTRVVCGTHADWHRRQAATFADEHGRFYVRSLDDADRLAGALFPEDGEHYMPAWAFEQHDRWRLPFEVAPVRPEPAPFTAEDEAALASAPPDQQEEISTELLRVAEGQPHAD